MSDDEITVLPLPEHGDNSFLEVLKSEEFHVNLCKHVSNGGSPIDYCKKFNIEYADYSNYLYENKDKYNTLQHAYKMRMEWAIERVLLEIRRMAFTDSSQVYDSEGNIRPISEWPEDLQRSVVAIEVFEEYQGQGKQREYIGRTKRVKFVDKKGALELLGKNLKLFSDVLQLEAGETLEQVIMKTAAKKVINE